MPLFQSCLVEMKIYFAGAIRGGREDVALYLKVVELLRPHGAVLTEHIADSQLTSLGESADDRPIHDRDLAWLKEADCLVAEVTTPSLGVGFEIGKATEWGLRVLCLFRPSAGRVLSALIAGCSRVTVREYQSAADLSGIFDDFFVTPRTER
jgi:2'-deoxynucleoside 5'-phosphate N-hydrolase